MGAIILFTLKRALTFLMRRKKLPNTKRVNEFAAAS